MGFIRKKSVNLVTGHKKRVNLLPIGVLAFFVRVSEACFF